MNKQVSGPGWFAKICVACCSLVICLVIAEAGLRLAGSIYEKRREGQERVFFSPRSYIESMPSQEKTEEQVFLAMGDSYTHNGNVPFEKSWCSTLQTQLNKTCTQTPFYVLNGGVCEYNSSQLIAKVRQYLPRFKPDVLIILSGSSNRFNLAFTEDRFDPHPVVNFFRSLRLFKVMRGIYLNYKTRGVVLDAQREILKNEKFVDNYGYDRALRAFKEMDQFSNMGADGYPKVSFHNIFINYYQSLPPDSKEGKVWALLEDKTPEKALALCKEILRDLPDDMRIECLLAWCQLRAHKARKAAKLYDKLLKKYPSSSFVKAHTAEFYHFLGDLMSRDLNYDEAVHCYLQAIRFDPYEYTGLYNLEVAYPLQSRYDAKTIVRQFEDMVRENPRLKNNQMFLNYLEFFKNRDVWEDRVYKWLEDDLEEIVELCRKNGITLVMQNYPFPFHKANETLEMVAKRHNIPFVNNYKVFSRLTAPGEENWHDYFADDDHCTALGYSIMRDNVFKVLVKSGIVKLHKNAAEPVAD